MRAQTGLPAESAVLAVLAVASSLVGAHASRVLPAAAPSLHQMCWDHLHLPSPHAGRAFSVLLPDQTQMHAEYLCGRKLAESYGPRNRECFGC